MRRAQLLRQERSGLVKVRVTGNDHCGAPSAVMDGVVPTKYMVVLDVFPGDTDERGFLIDQERLHNFLADTASNPLPWPGSCEELVLDWGSRLYEWIHTENVVLSVRKLSLTLSPSPHLGAFTAIFDNT